MTSDTSLTRNISLSATPHFDLKQSLEMIKESGATDKLDTFADDYSWLVRPVLLNERPYLLRIINLAKDDESAKLELSLTADDEADDPPDEAALTAAQEWANRRLFLDVDMEAVRQTLAVNEYGEQLVARYWPARPGNFPSAWEGLLVTIIKVQVYAGMASRMQQSLLDFYGSKVKFDGVEYRLFPSVERLAQVTPEELIDLRFSRQKAKYLVGIAEAILAKPERYDFERLRSLPGDEAAAILDELPGVGPWTAYQVAMRGLPGLDVLVDEEGVRKTLGQELDHHAALSHAEAAKRVAVFAPYRSFLTYYTYMRMFVG